MKEIHDQIHFFSWVTRVSLELPIGFEEQKADSDQSMVIYANDLDDDITGTKVIVHQHPIPAQDNDPVQSLADVLVRDSAKPERKRRVFDGYEGIVQEQEFILENENFYRIDGIFLAGDSLFSIACVCPFELIQTYQREFFTILNSVRLIQSFATNLPDRTPNDIPATKSLQSRSWTDPSTRLSLIFPRDWEPSNPSENHFQLQAPPLTEHHDYIPVMGFTLGEPENYGDQWFEEFCGLSRAMIAGAYPKSKPHPPQKLTLSSFGKGSLDIFDWEPEEGVKITQVQALYLVDRYTLYVIHAAVLQEQSTEWLGKFMEVIKSLRMLPNQSVYHENRK